MLHKTGLHSGSTRLNYEWRSIARGRTRVLAMRVSPGLCGSCKNVYEKKNDYWCPTFTAFHPFSYSNNLFSWIQFVCYTSKIHQFYIFEIEMYAYIKDGEWIKFSSVNMEKLMWDMKRYHVSTSMIVKRIVTLLLVWKGS